MGLNHYNRILCKTISLLVLRVHVSLAKESRARASRSVILLLFRVIIQSLLETRAMRVFAVMKYFKLELVLVLRSQSFISIISDLTHSTFKHHPNKWWSLKISSWTPRLVFILMWRFPVQKVNTMIPKDPLLSNTTFLLAAPLTLIVVLTTSAYPLIHYPDPVFYQKWEISTQQSLYLTLTQVGVQINA